MEEKIAVVAAVLDNPAKSQHKFNSTIAEFKDLIRGRLGLPLSDKGVAAISIIVIGSIDNINSLTGKLGNIEGVNVKTSISKKEI
ncbi:TM1266 family iron-only hydrogenase system putative regulator [Halocella sp. SP3-1]|uniref:TM1266 family iron-only hydrogenase system putative regulator n=1 Tax=Halocella sp. SP3-1 TaxID=2382161 RepID=UPI000F75988E|nr:TM1266 family iron-only hydrogenase system putative regulator [Halocella sp. SP3-1]AZO94668.1 iron-only hydrogenase system regulator [Halocella sp. SP3-1]